MAVVSYEVARGKITSLRRAPAGAAEGFELVEDLRALVAGWPWLPKGPSLLLPQENDPIFWVQAGGSRADLMGVSREGRLVAAEVMLDPFVDRKPALKHVLRGLCRLQDRAALPGGLAGPYGADHRRAMTAVFVGDAAVFPKDAKQLKKISKDLRALLDEPGASWDRIKGGGGDRTDTKTPQFVAAGFEQPLHFLVVAVGRTSEGGALRLRVERVWDQMLEVAARPG